MKVLLTGATGFIGRNLRHTLEVAGHEVLAVSRASGIDFNNCLSPQDWLPHLKDVDAVVNTVGIIGQVGEQRFAPLHTQAPVALFKACVQAGVRRVVQVSALGADETAFSHYHLSKRAADDALRRLDLDWFVLRPSLVYGKGGTSTRMFMRVAALPCLPVLDKGQQAVQPVHIRDVVAAIVKCLQTAHTRQTVDLVGPQALPFVDYLQTMRIAQGRPRTPCVVHVPIRMALCAVWPVRHFSALLQADNLRMLASAAATASASVLPFEQLLGRSPRAIASHLFFEDTLTSGDAS